jgi:hypothetical protein
MAKEKPPPPKNWPDSFTYTTKSYSTKIHPSIIHHFLLASKDDTSTCTSKLLDNNQTHPLLSIKVLEEDVKLSHHPLYGKTSLFGHKERGVFANNTIPKDEIIGEYVGDITIAMPPFTFTKNAISSYSWYISFGSHYLVIEPNKYCNELVLINDYRNIATQPNTKGDIVIHNGKFTFVYKTLSTIDADEEVLVDYGDTYWQIYNDKLSHKQ